jgi:hypothetical protein
MNTQQVEYVRKPVKPTIQPLKPAPYGVIEGLDPGELADPQELERIAYLRFFEPVLSLPKKKERSPFMPEIAGGAFDTWDFHRMFPQIQHYARTKRTLYGLNIKLNDRLNMLSILKKRLTTSQRVQAITAARSRSDLSELGDDNTRIFAQEYRRSLQLRNRIHKIRTNGILKRAARCR